MATPTSMPLHKIKSYFHNINFEENCLKAWYEWPMSEPNWNPKIGPEWPKMGHNLKHY